MAENKTQPTRQSVASFIAGIEPEERRRDCRAVVKLMKAANVMAGFDRYPALMKKLGKHTTGRACLYIKRLSDVDTNVLTKLVKESVAHMMKRYPTTG